jgi:hypothetical protein
MNGIMHTSLLVGVSCSQVAPPPGASASAHSATQRASRTSRPRHATSRSRRCVAPRAFVCSHPSLSVPWCLLAFRGGRSWLAGAAPRSLACSSRRCVRGAGRHTATPRRGRASELDRQTAHGARHVPACQHTVVASAPGLLFTARLLSVDLAVAHGVQGGESRDGSDRGLAYL